MHHNNFWNFYTREIYAIPIPIGFIPIPIPIPIMSRTAIPIPMGMGFPLPCTSSYCATDQRGRLQYRVVQKKRGHSTFFKISRKLLKISK